MNSISGIPTLDNYYENVLFNPILIIVLVIIILLYLVFFGSLGGSFLSSSSSSEDLFTSNTSNNGSSNKQLKFLGIIFVSIFIVLILINGFNYFLNINIVTSITDFFSKTPEINILAESDLTSGSDIVPEIKYIEQVYHIPGNEYTYENAQALCKAYGNRLATYKEVEKAYDRGANWCSFGWSEDQMALYPTQYKTWKKLQKVKGHEHDCGRPGINGGYIDNPNVRFGVNCYGYKPKINQLESELMKNAPEYPLTQKELNFENRVEYWKNKVNDILVAPFNRKKWSRV